MARYDEAVIYSMRTAAAISASRCHLCLPSTISLQIMPHSEIIVLGGSYRRDAYDEIMKVVYDVFGGYSHRA